MADTINCFDQLIESSKVRIQKTEVCNYITKKARFGLNNKVKFLNFIMPPLIAIFSLILCSSTFIYFHNPVEVKEKIINPGKPKLPAKLVINDVLKFGFFLPSKKPMPTIKNTGNRTSKSFK